jgi:hypothetical protein
MEEAELLELLEAARVRNGELGITGLLLYAEGNFIQVIEGAPDGVELLYRRIKRDPRHRRFTPLLDHMIESRNFEGWQMGFERIKSEALRQATGVADLMACTPSGSKAAAHRLIESFRRATVTRSPRDSSRG